MQALRDGVDSVHEGAQALRRALDAWAARGGVRAEITRLEIAVAPVDPLAWLAGQPAGGRAFFASRDGSVRVAGLGTALAHDAKDFAALRHAEAGAGLRWLLTARFDLARPPAPEWAPFGAVRLALPAVELRQDDAGCTLACHLAPGDAERAATAARRALATVAAAGSPAQTPRAPAAPREDAMTPAWARSVDELLREIRAGRLQKAVLARRRDHAAPAGLCPVRLLAALATRQPRTFLFCVEPAPGHAFVGASPELLYHRRGRALATEALAGTRPRGATEADDRRLAGELGASAKDRLEHGVVCEHIRERLAPACAELHADRAPALHRLAHVQHLRTAFEARLRADASDAGVLARLHPTPAVGGTPVEAALARLRACEPFDRGLYGGAVGLVGSDEAECAVAIRSGLWAGGALHLYAGAGIVDGSWPAAEWDETESKLRAFTAAWEGWPR